MNSLKHPYKSSKLNTLSNLGGTWPKYFILNAVEVFGYFTVGSIGIIVQTFIFISYIKPNVLELQGLKGKSWRLEEKEDMNVRLNVTLDESVHNSSRQPLTSSRRKGSTSSDTS